ncbi:MAG: hypothetical protein JO366_19335 [Methylobacteriaceae bacterium]|nr:hypothetical protein [Methylobacteriaceae bacterium]MBV9217854.1 hypothetical protein [Methylobacteriaceae bacterium]MBV9246958.1 hypothetical protein [Methylobacteriaceae bacterium]MBV9637076.1 hypothetical protein [Methylobacteriaceae bacterium]MBV9704218.1 hypothetical protein [Methylobacteriaceae bacterium]
MAEESSNLPAAASHTSAMAAGERSVPPQERRVSKGRSRVKVIAGIALAIAIVGIVTDGLIGLWNTYRPVTSDFIRPYLQSKSWAPESPGPKFEAFPGKECRSPPCR